MPQVRFHVQEFDLACDAYFRFNTRLVVFVYITMLRFVSAVSSFFFMSFFSNPSFASTSCPPLLLRSAEEILQQPSNSKPMLT